MIASYQRLIDSHNLGPNKCKFCSKCFVTPSYLMAHCERRHPERAPFDIDLTAGAEYAAKVAAEKAAAAANADKLGALPDLVRDLQTEIKIVRSEIGRGPPAAQAAQPYGMQADPYEVQRLRAELAQRDSEISQLKAEVQHRGSTGGEAALRAELEQKHELAMAKQREEFRVERESLETKLQTQHARELEIQIEQTVQAAKSNLGPMHDDVEDMALQAKAKADKEQYLRNEEQYEKQIALLEGVIKSFVESGVVAGSVGRSSSAAAAVAAAVPVAKAGASRKKANAKKAPPSSSSNASSSEDDDTDDNSTSSASTSSSEAASPKAAPKNPKKIVHKTASAKSAGSAGAGGGGGGKKASGKKTTDATKGKGKGKEKGLGAVAKGAKKEAAGLPRKSNKDSKGKSAATITSKKPKPGKVSNKHKASDGKHFVVETMFKHSSKDVATVRETVEATFEQYMVEAGVSRGATQMSESHLDDALNVLETVINERSYSRVWAGNRKGKKPGPSVYAELETQTDNDLATAEKKFYHNPRDASTSSEDGSEDEDEVTEEEEDTGHRAGANVVVGSGADLADEDEAENASSNNNAVQVAPPKPKRSMGRGAPATRDADDADEVEPEEAGNATQESFMSSAMSSDVSSNVSSVVPEEDGMEEVMLDDASPVAAKRPATMSPASPVAGDAKTLSATLATEALDFRKQKTHGQQDDGGDQQHGRPETVSPMTDADDDENRGATVASPPVELDDSFESVSSNGSLQSDSLGGLSSHHGGDSNIDSLSGLLQERGHISGGGPSMPPPEPPSRMPSGPTSAPPAPPPRGSPPAPPPRPTTASPVADDRMLQGRPETVSPLTDEPASDGAMSPPVELKSDDGNGGGGGGGDLVGAMSPLSEESDWDDDLSEGTLSK